MLQKEHCSESRNLVRLSGVYRTDCMF